MGRCVQHSLFSKYIFIIEIIFEEGNTRTWQKGRREWNEYYYLTDVFVKELFYVAETS